MSTRSGRRFPRSTMRIKRNLTSSLLCPHREASDCGKLCFRSHQYVHSWSTIYRDQASSVTPEQHDAALRSLDVYKRWLLDTYLQGRRSNPILVLPLGDVAPDHRDEWPGYVCATWFQLHAHDYRPTSSEQQLWEPLLIAPVIGAPELVVPSTLNISFLRMCS